MKLRLMYFKIILIFSIILTTSYPSFLYFSLADDIESNTDISNTLNENQTILETSSTDNDSKLNLNSRSCIVFDRTSKQILFGKNEYNKVKMASTTKIMTAIVVIEQGDLDKTIEISKKAANTGGSRLGLKTGDKVTIRNLLYGLMLCSGNDAAVALAEGIAGSVNDFSVLMNTKAEELGLTNSHFESPHGLDSDGHYTTAYELAKLTDYALNNKTFSQIVGTKTCTVTINDSSKNLSNTNELLGNLNGVYGVKTGFTNGANRCLVTACKRDDIDIITVVLGCDTKKFRTQDSIKLINYTFENFEHINIEDLITKKTEQWKLDNLDSFTVNKGISNNVELSISKLEYPIMAIKKGTSEKIDISISVNKNLESPVTQGDIIGNISVLSEGSELANSYILVSNNIYKKSVSEYLYNFLKDYNSKISELFNY